MSQPLRIRPSQMRDGASQCFVLILAFILTVSGSRLALAHEAPSGWTYDLDCCGNGDCGLEQAEVRATAVGWLITATGETIPYGDRRIHDSKDGEFHRCHVIKNGTASNETRCLYVPPMGL